MKVLVLGASGMAGHIVALYFKERGHEVVSFSRTPFLFTENIIGDVFDTQKFISILLEGNYDVVINCIGILNQVAENNHSKAVYLNSYLPHLIAETFKDSFTKFIHMSTDCVFAGNSGPYFENSFCDGKSFYDRTKALGEINDIKNLTLRNSIIGPDMNKNGIGLFNWFMLQNKTVNGYTGAIWTGVTTLTLAKAMEAAASQNLCGLYNLVNNDNISKYNLVKLFNKYFRNELLNIKENERYVSDKTLLNTRTDFNFRVPSYEQMIIELNIWMTKHPELYPHYQ